MAVELKYKGIRNDPALLLYMRMEGNANDDLGVSTPVSDANVAYGASYGRFGQGADFNGSSAQIDMGQSLTITGTGAFTFAIWAKVDTYQAQNAITYYITAGSKIQIQLYTAGAIYFQRGGTYATTTFTDTTTWHRFVMTYDGSNIRGYIDGVLVGTQADTNSITATDKHLYIGSGGGTQWCDAKMDDITILSRALSADEVREDFRDDPYFHNYKGSIGRFFSKDRSMLAYYQFNGNSRDNSGNGFNGSDAGINYVPEQTGKKKMVAHFSGGTPTITTSLDSQLEGLSGFTALGIIKRGGSEANFAGIFSKYAASQNSIDFLLAGTLGGNDDLFFRVGNGTDDVFVYTSSGVLSTNRYHVVAAVFDGTLASADRLKIYVDGIRCAVTLTNTPGTTTPANATALSFGNYQTNYFGGKIKEFAFLRRAVSAQEVAQFYKTTLSQGSGLAYKKWWASTVNVISRTFTETATFASSMIRTAQRIMSETATFTDVITSAKVMIETLTETATFNAAMVRTIGRIFTQLPMFSAALVKGAVRSFVETGTFTDPTIGHSLIKIGTFSETANFVLSLFRTMQRTYEETGSFSAAFSSMANRIRTYTESVTYSATVTRSTTRSRVLTEVATFAATCIAYLNGMRAGLWRRVARATDRVWTKISKNF